MGNFCEYLQPQYSRRNHEICFSFKMVTWEDVLQIVQGLKNSGTGHDGFPMCVFKDNILILVDTVQIICKRSLSSSIFPERLTLAEVICLHKSGTRLNPANYRPISLLPAFRKKK